jgi:sortase A
MSANSRRVRGMRGRVLTTVEVTLVTLGAVCLGWYGGVRVAAFREQVSLSRQLEATTLGTLGTAGRRTPGTSGTTGTGMGTSPGTLIARIDLPRLSLSAVAREGVDAHTLDIAIGHVPGTALPGDGGNAAFAAHRDTFFRPLRRVQAGDVLNVATPRGSYRYVVTSTRVVDPDDVSVLNPTSEPTLTLVTCYPFTYIGSAPYRFIVRAELLPATAPPRRSSW